MNLPPMSKLTFTSAEKELIQPCCLNCFKSELNLYKCTNLNCCGNYCLNCLENSLSFICLKCKSGNLILEDNTQLKCKIF